MDGREGQNPLPTKILTSVLLQIPGLQLAMQPLILTMHQKGCRFYPFGCAAAALLAPLASACGASKVLMPGEVLVVKNIFIVGIKRKKYFFLFCFIQTLIFTKLFHFEAKQKEMN
jgi:hypothetical protein